MEFRNLGASGLKVSRLIVGGAHIGDVLDEAATRDVFHAAWDAGINALYTADSYNGGAAQEILGRVIEDRRDDLVVISKIGHRLNAALGENKAARFGTLDDSKLAAQGVPVNSYGVSRKYLTKALDESLRRLRTDYVDVCSMHEWDSRTPIEETLETLAQFVRDGKARYIGCSNYAAWQLYRALWVSDVRRLPAPRAFQTEYNLLNRFPEREQLPACEAGGVGVLVFNSLAGNVLAGRDLAELGDVAGAGRKHHVDEYMGDDDLSRARRLMELAGELGREPGELAQGWVLSHRAVTSLLIGPNEPGEIHAQVKAVERPLTDDEVKAVAEVAVPAPPIGQSRSPR